jgi:hypothetical protein
MDYIRPTPRNPIYGLLADELEKLYSPTQTQQMQGLMKFLMVPEVSKTMNLLAYGEPLTTGAGGIGGTTRVKPEVLDAAMAVAPMAPVAGRAARGTARMVGREMADRVTTGRSMLPSMLAEPKSAMFAVEPNAPRININKGIYKDELTMEEMLKVKDIPTVDRVRQSIDLVGEKEFENLVNAQFKKYKPTDQDQEAMLVESVTLQILGKAQRSPYPQQAALDTAQKNAALPISEGGLGLPSTNTPMDRAKAMGGIDAVHFSRKGGDYTELDSGKFAIAPFDAVGTHVGTPQAAMERFQNTVGYKVNNPNYASDELTGATYQVKVLGDKPLLNQNNMPWGEDDLNAFLRKTGGHNWSDINNGNLSYQDLNAGLRKKLFEEEGYTSIPYFNEVEGKGSISYIVPPKNIRSQFAAFDPMRRNESDILAGLLPASLLADPETRRKLDEELSLLYTK